MIIHCENKNLTYDRPISRRVNRWKLLLEEYDYEIRHVNGSENNLADYLSKTSFCKTSSSSTKTLKNKLEFHLPTLSISTKLNDDQKIATLKKLAG